MGQARLLFCKSQADKQYLICLNVNENLHKAEIWSGLTFYNYRGHGYNVEIKRKLFNKRNFECNFLNALWPALANGLLGVGLVLWGSSLSCVRGDNALSSAIIDKALLCLVILEVLDDNPQTRNTHLSPFMSLRCRVVHQGTRFVTTNIDHAALNGLLHRTKCDNKLLFSNGWFMTSCCFNPYQTISLGSFYDH